MKQKLLIKICRYCKREFSHGSKLQKFCNAACVRGHRASNKPTGQCAICGKDFSMRLPSSKYCSEECRYQGQRALVIASRKKKNGPLLKAPAEDRTNILKAAEYKKALNLIKSGFVPTTPESLEHMRRAEKILREWGGSTIEVLDLEKH